MRGSTTPLRREKLKIASLRECKIKLWLRGLCTEYKALDVPPPANDTKLGVARTLSEQRDRCC